MKRNQAKIRNLSRDELWDVANSLSLVDMTALINMFSRDISVNVGTIGGCGIEVDLYDSEVVTATLNGHSILIDSHMCGLDDMMEDEYFSQAVYKYFISIGVPDEEMEKLIAYHQRAIAKTKSKGNNENQETGG